MVGAAGLVVVVAASAAGSVVLLLVVAASSVSSVPVTEWCVFSSSVVPTSVAVVVGTAIDSS